MPKPHILLSVIFCLIGVVTRAQTPWQGFLPGRTAHYTVKPAGVFRDIDSLEAVYEVARFDSVDITPGYTDYFSMTTSGSDWWSHNAYDYTPYELDTLWVGPKMRQALFYEEYFPRQGGTVHIDKDRMRLMDTALTWRNGAEYLCGIVEAIRADTVLQEPDSVATMRLIHVTSPGHQGLLQDRVLKLSQNHGWVKSIDFFHLGADTLYRNLALLSGSPVDYAYPSYASWNNYQVGDMVQYREYKNHTQTASCFGSTGGWGGIATSQHHRRLLRRETTPLGIALVWQDSSQNHYHPNQWGLHDTTYIRVDTLADNIPYRPDSARISGASFEFRRDRQNNTFSSPPLARTRDRFVRLNFEGGISGVTWSYVLNPFGMIYQFDNWSPNGHCESSFTITYATCNGDTLGTPGFFTGIRKLKPQANLLTLSPNPAGSKVMVRVNVQRPHTFDLFRTDGSRVLSKTVNSSGNLDIASLPPGLYLWQARQGDHLQTGKLVKE